MNQRESRYQSLLLHVIHECSIELLNYIRNSTDKFDSRLCSATEERIKALEPPAAMNAPADDDDIDQLNLEQGAYDDDIPRKTEGNAYMFRMFRAQ